MSKLTARQVDTLGARALIGLAKNDTTPEARVALVATLADNLATWYGRARADQKRAGRYWYRHARDTADIIAERNSLTREQATGLIAVLSPRCSWEVNIERAESAAMGLLDSIGLADQVSKVRRILAGEDPYTVAMGRDAHKVRRFYLNIIGDYSVATVDIWHLRAALDDRSAGDREYKLGVHTAHRYGILEEATKLAAERAHETVAEYQAIVWLTIRHWEDDPVDDKPEAF